MTNLLTEKLKKKSKMSFALILILLAFIRRSQSQFNATATATLIRKTGWGDQIEFAPSNCTNTIIARTSKQGALSRTNPVEFKVLEWDAVPPPSRSTITDIEIEFVRSADDYGVDGTLGIGVNSSKALNFINRRTPARGTTTWNGLWSLDEANRDAFAIAEELQVRYDGYVTTLGRLSVRSVGFRIACVRIKLHYTFFEESVVFTNPPTKASESASDSLAIDAVDRTNTLSTLVAGSNDIENDKKNSAGLLIAVIASALIVACILFVLFALKTSKQESKADHGELARGSSGSLPVGTYMQAPANSNYGPAPSLSVTESETTVYDPMPMSDSLRLPGYEALDLQKGKETPDYGFGEMQTNTRSGMGAANQ